MGVAQKIMGIPNRALRSICDEGVARTCKKISDKIQRKLGLKIGDYTQKELEAQKKVCFSKNITFSILVPLYNTPEKFLREMIASVQAQTYNKWQLCLADGSDEVHGDVGRVCLEYAASDSRVCYRKLTKNLGISGNTNACIEMATGEYIALFDHDDLLHPAALYEMMRAICEHDADFVYTDEDSFFLTPNDAYSPHYKPDFAPDTFRSYNYICHFTAFDRNLLKITGGFRSEFDGSQDYDLFLRLTEQAKMIVHIPRILYYWRNHAASTAANVSAKPYTMVSGKKALSEHLQRVGLRGTVMDSSAPTTYRIAYEINGAPLVSVIYGGAADLSNTTYPNYERTNLQQAKGAYLLFLEPDAMSVSSDWIEQMLMFAQQDDVGPVGALVYDASDRVIHGGEVLFSGGELGFAHRGLHKDEEGYKFRLSLAQNYSAVSAACMMVRRDVYQKCGDMDFYMGELMGADFSLRAADYGYRCVWTPYAQVKSVAHSVTDDTRLRFANKWKNGNCDPNYNPRLEENPRGFAMK